MPHNLCELPKELLLKVRSHIHSLHDHVQFSLACKTTYNLYDDDFWRFACFTSGYSIKIKSPQATKAFNAAKEKDPAISIWAGLARVVVADEPTFKGYKELQWSTHDDSGLLLHMDTLRLMLNAHSLSLSFLHQLSSKPISHPSSSSGLCRHRCLTVRTSKSSSTAISAVVGASLSSKCSRSATMKMKTGITIMHLAHLNTPSLQTES